MAKIRQEEKEKKGKGRVRWRDGIHKAGKTKEGRALALGIEGWVGGRLVPCLVVHCSDSVTRLPKLTTINTRSGTVRLHPSPLSSSSSSSSPASLPDNSTQSNQGCPFALASSSSSPPPSFFLFCSSFSLLLFFALSLLFFLFLPVSCPVLLCPTTEQRHEKKNFSPLSLSPSTTEHLQEK